MVELEELRARVPSDGLVKIQSMQLGDRPGERSDC